MLPKGRKISMQSFLASNEPTTSKTDYGATSCLGAYRFILPKSSPNNLGETLNPFWIVSPTGETAFLERAQRNAHVKGERRRSNTVKESLLVGGEEM